MMHYSVNNFIDNLHKELNKQTQTFLKLKKLAKNQEMIFGKSELDNLTKIKSEKERLLHLIRIHNKQLTEFQKAWVQRRSQFSPELQTAIHHKIEELRAIVSDILETERIVVKRNEQARNRTENIRSRSK